MPVTGARAKFWVLHPLTRRPGLVKIARRRGTPPIPEGELVSEYLASLVGQALSIQVAVVIPVKKTVSGDVELCPLSWKFTGPEEELKEGAAITDTVERYRPPGPGARPHTERKREQLSVSRIESALLNELQDLSIARRFISQILIFDVLVANTDRHQGNWGIVVDPGNGWVRPAPLYDNGASFGSTSTPTGLMKILDEKRLDLFNDRYVHEFSVQDASPRNSRIPEIMGFLRGPAYESYFRVFQEWVKNLDVDAVCHQVHEEVKGVADHRQRLIFAGELLKSRRTIILQEALA